MYRKSKLSQAITMAIASGAVGVSGSALAQEQEDGSRTLEVIIVTATKREENLQSIPVAVQAMDAEMLEVLESEYVRFAWAKGLPPKRIWFLHALKNTLLPVITVGGVQIGTLIAYTILTETVFQWPGLGFLFLEAVNRVDTPLIIAYIIVVGLIFVITNTIVDLIYTMINPMVKLNEAAR